MRVIFAGFGESRNIPLVEMRHIAASRSPI